MAGVARYDDASFLEVPTLQRLWRLEHAPRVGVFILEFDDVAFRSQGDLDRLATATAAVDLPPNGHAARDSARNSGAELGPYRVDFSSIEEDRSRSS